MRGVKSLKPAIGLARVGCRNRPFYQIVVSPHAAYGRKWTGNIIEQIGSFDPIPNNRDEKLVAINFSRLNYWITQDCHFSKRVLELLGVSGYFPVYPQTYVAAKQLRESQKKEPSEKADNQ